MTTCTEKPPINASLVTNEDDRLAFAPVLFGDRFALRGMGLVYAAMRRNCEEYSGGQWDFYRLSNGGMFMAPRSEKPFHLQFMNYVIGDLSSEAAGIVSTLFALNQLWERSMDDDCLARCYQLLLDYAQEHPEKALIQAALN